MFKMWLTQVPENIIVLAGVLFAFVLTCVLLAACQRFLPRDHGRDYAVNGELSAGKPRGAGILLIIVFIAAVLLFCEWDTEMLIYLVLLAVSMMTGFLDDRSTVSWNEYKKGILDLIVAVLVAVTFLYYNDSSIVFALFGSEMVLPAPVFAILTVILVWASINVTNCSDGVDGLSGTLGMITLMSFFIADNILGSSEIFTGTILLFVICILAYQWFNATPSRLMMGDAGSRAMGFFIAITALKSGSPLLYIFFAIVLILDGGLGLVKVSLLRFLKIGILEKVRTPLHDHVRKNMGWSNTQAVFRFAIIQIMVSAVVICLLA